MKLSKLIKNLQKILKEKGDIPCIYAIDDEWNEHHAIQFNPTVVIINKKDKDSKYIEISDYEWQELNEKEEILAVIVN